MLKQFAFFYLMKNEPQKIGSIIPAHISYWDEVKAPNYSGGPFSDRSGGLILFEAKSFEEASQIALNDPFITQNLIETHWLKEWMRK